MIGISAYQAPGRAVRWWLLSVAALIAIMVLVGGATRLTESGLSIVEWKPVTGTLPPLTEAQWTQAFEGYKIIPQYRELNAGMSLTEFKTIFWWEWSHRLLGRVVDGGLRAHAAGRGIPISAGDALDIGTRDLRCDRLDAAAAGGATAVRCKPTAEDHQRGVAGACLPAALFRRAGRGPARGQGFQYLARYRRLFYSIRRAAVLRISMVAQSVRQYPDRAVRASHDRLCATGAGIAARLRRGWRPRRGRDRPRRLVARSCNRPAGDARHPHAAQSGADRSRANPSGGRDRGFDAGDFTSRTVGEIG